MIKTESSKIVKESELSYFYTTFPSSFFSFFFIPFSTILKFSLLLHISIVFPPPPPPPPHFYCFPSTTTSSSSSSSFSSSSFLLFPLEKAEEAKIRPKRPNSDVMAWFWPLWPFRGKTIEMSRRRRRRRRWWWWWWWREKNRNLVVVEGKQKKRGGGGKIINCGEGNKKQGEKWGGKRSVKKRWLASFDYFNRFRLNHWVFYTFCNY